MDIYGAKFQEHCFNNFRDIVYSVFTTLQLHVVWHHHWSNLHNGKTSISLKRKKIFQKEKRHSSVFWKAFQISRKFFLCHIHFKWFRRKNNLRGLRTTQRETAKQAILPNNILVFTLWRFTRKTEMQVFNLRQLASPFGQGFIYTTALRV